MRNIYWIRHKVRWSRRVDPKSRKLMSILCRSPVCPKQGLRCNAFKVYRNIYWIRHKVRWSRRMDPKSAELTLILYRFPVCPKAFDITGSRYIGIFTGSDIR